MLSLINFFYAAEHLFGMVFVLKKKVQKNNSQFGELNLISFAWKTLNFHVETCSSNSLVFCIVINIIKLAAFE